MMARVELRVCASLLGTMATGLICSSACVTYSMAALLRWVWMFARLPFCPSSLKKFHIMYSLFDICISYDETLCVVEKMRGMAVFFNGCCQNPQGVSANKQLMPTQPLPAWRPMAVDTGSMNSGSWPKLSRVNSANCCACSGAAA